MAAKSLPNLGNVFLGAGGVAKIAKVTIGFSGNDVDFDAQETLAIFNVPADTLVLGVKAYTNTAWTTSVTITIGDGDDADGFMASAKIAPTTAQTNGILKSTDVATAEAYAGGKLYESADTIDAVVGGATPDAGQTDVYIVYIPNFSEVVKLN